jgi:hypothetical protein
MAKAALTEVSAGRPLTYAELRDLRNAFAIALRCRSATA